MPELIQMLRDNPEQFRDRRVGQYSLKKFLGMGGTGGVFRAIHLPFGRTVALKLFFPLESQMESVTKATERAIRGLGSLRHPAIAELLDFGVVAGFHRRTAYLAHELVAGCSLHEWSYSIRDGVHVDHRRLNVALEIAKALRSAHNCTFTGNLGFQEHGVLHGDLKPSNILIGHDDKPKLLDFMVPDLQALLTNHANWGTYWKKDSNDKYWYEVPLTAAFGTPGYMPPEQELDGIVTPVSDIYTLGMTFRRHFWPCHSGPGFDEMAVWESRCGHGRPCENQVARLVTEMTATQPSGRLQSMSDVVERLASILDCATQLENTA